MMTHLDVIFSCVFVVVVFSSSFFRRRRRTFSSGVTVESNYIAFEHVDRSHLVSRSVG